MTWYMTPPVACCSPIQGLPSVQIPFDGLRGGRRSETVSLDAAIKLRDELTAIILRATGSES